MTGYMKKYAKVAVNIPLDKIFHYEIPENLKDEIAVGKRVWVEFRNAPEVGYVTGFTDEKEIDDIKPVKSIIDQFPIISDEMMSLTKWISENYICSWGEALSAVIPGVLKKGKVSVKPRTKKQGEKKYAAASHYILTQEQKSAFNKVAESINENTHKTFLLHGITGSGKTEIYLQAIAKVLEMGKSSIVLVPEISLTPQTVERFESRFGDKVAVIHSALIGSMKFSEWKRIKDKEAKVIIGARSAVFSPVSNLGLIVIDEEHEGTYKQEDVPRYHAREVALKRAQNFNCPVILGSATPSMESYYKAQKGEYKLLKLSKRIDDRPLPNVRIVDMRQELASKKKLVMFSALLVKQMEAVIKNKKQAIIFLNRRGFSTYINCKACGYVAKCKQCDAIMVYHFDEKKLICHYCNYSINPPNICPVCRSGYIRYFGIGTQKIESELALLLPNARIARMDTDATAKRGSHDKILGDFKNHNIDLLVGTQMIAKGLDFPDVTLVGVVNSDVTLNLPDFRAGEKTFGLITQVAGRAGRSDAGGEVVVQTYSPDHYAIQAAAKHDYEAFYEKEMKSRSDLKFPPIVSLIKITFRSRSSLKAHEAAVKISGELVGKMQDTEFLGPAPSPMAKLRGYYRWNLLLKTKVQYKTAQDLKEAFSRIRKPSGVFIAVDVDPMNM